MRKGNRREQKSVVSKKASDLARIDRMKDSEIDYSDIPRLDKTFFKKATMPWPPAKKQLTIRLDEDVLDWLKRHGKGYSLRSTHRCFPLPNCPGLESAQSGAADRP